MISSQVGDLSSHTTKYASYALTQKVFANMRREGKGFSRVDTPLFEGMLVPQQVADDVATDDIADVVADDVADVVAEDVVEPTPPSRRCIQTGGIIAEIDADEDVILEEVNAEKDVAVQGRQEESQAQAYHIDLEHADKVLITVAATTITAAPSAARRRKGVVIRELKKTATPSTIVKRKDKKDNAVLRYQALKRKPQIEVLARKNMMVYLKNMAGFKMNLFKGMSYDDIRPIFEKHFNSIVGFLEKSEKELEEKASRALKRKSKSSEQQAIKKKKLDEEVEELKTHLQIVPDDEYDVYTEATPLALKVPIVDYQIHTENNKPYYKVIRAGGTHQLFLSFLGLLRNFDREDLEVLWKIVQKIFASSKLKNFSGIHGLAKVKSWKLLESCGVHIIAFTTTQMILLVERRYPLTRFTLDQMLNNVRLEVEEESEVSLELLRFVRRQHQEGYRPE
uniref:Uncharacterized protein n=1 Tax=Tanacetum cinerariifolium TaxID=118510 RepID=A0A6L2NHY7_TANCI|nr:hypothetical protein [Tanacetum cinerariifolium]